MNINNTFRVLLLTGPRQVGKTTILKKLMKENMNYVTLDDLNFGASARNNLKQFLGKHITREMLKNFDKLKNTKKEIGPGGIICCYNELILLDEKNYIIPFSSVINS